MRPLWSAVVVVVELFHVTMAPGSDDATKVLHYIISVWLAKRMVVYPEVVSTQPPGTRPRLLFHAQRPQLHYNSTEYIMGSLYSFELKKLPNVYWLERLTVEKILPPASQISGTSCADHANPGPPVVAVDKIVNHPSGFYRCTIVMTQESESLMKLEFIRL